MGNDRGASEPSKIARPDAGGMLRLSICFLVPCLVSWVVTAIWVPLELHQAEEYWSLAQTPDAPPSLLRPPGYIEFLRLVGGAAHGFAPLYAAQAGLLGLASAAFFLVARRWLNPAAACVLALAFGCHPLAVVLVGYVHYDLLHLALLVLTSWCVVSAFGGSRISLPWAALAGLAVGLTTLTRPMTLAYPAVLAVALWWLRPENRKASLLGWLALTAAMSLTLAPRALDNFQRTGRLVPVNAQSGAAFWPMTQIALHPTSDNFPWASAWWPAGDALVRSHLPPPYSADAFMTQTLTMDDLFKTEAWKLFRTQPTVYFENVAENLLFFWTGDSRRFIRAFLFYQIAEQPSRTAPWALGYFIFAGALLHMLAAYGAALALWRRERTLVLAGSLFLTLWLIHSLVYLDARYLYAGLPFFLWFGAYGLREIWPGQSRRDLAASAFLAALSLLGLGALLI